MASNMGDKILKNMVPYENLNLNIYNMSTDALRAKCYALLQENGSLKAQLDKIKSLVNDLGNSNGNLLIIDICYHALKKVLKKDEK